MFTSNNVYNEVLSNLFNGFGDLFKAVSPNEKETKGARIYTDIQEFCDRYELDMELPGFSKDEIKIELKNGYLNVIAKHEVKTEDNAEERTFISRERYTGTRSRSLYLGNYVQKEQIRASFNNGILKLTIPKDALVPKDSEETSISIDD